jgi:hypothetical protein
VFTVHVVVAWFTTDFVFVSITVITVIAVIAVIAIIVVARVVADWGVRVRRIRIDMAGVRGNGHGE